MSKIVGVGHGPRISDLPSAGAEPLIAEDFDGYADLDAYEATLPGGTSGFTNREHMSFDGTNGYGTSNQSLLYTFPDANGQADPCTYVTSLTHDIDLRPLVGDANTELREVWFEIWAMFGTEFSTVPNPEWNCTGNPDYKFIFGTIGNAGSGRFQVKLGTFGENGAYNMNAPDDSPLDFVQNGDATVRFNEQWSRYRMHMRFSSGVNGDDPDGIYRVWIEEGGVTPWIEQMGPGVIPHYNDAGQIYQMSIGRNRNHGADGDMRLWIGSYKAWNEAPSWNPAE